MEENLFMVLPLQGRRAGPLAEPKSNSSEEFRNSSTKLQLQNNSLPPLSSFYPGETEAQGGETTCPNPMLISAEQFLCVGDP